ncbi:MAG: hypothetical protein AAF149_25155 [Bacteroidota bacterium]
MKLKTYLYSISIFLSLAIYHNKISAQSISRNNSLAVVHMVNEDTKGATILATAIKGNNFKTPTNLYKNELDNPVLTIKKKVSSENIADIVQEEKITHDLLAYLIAESEGKVSADLLIERSKNELTEFELEKIERMSGGADESSLFSLYNELLNNSFLLVYFYDNIRELEAIDTVFHASDSSYSIVTTRHHVGSVSKFLLAPDFSDFVLNTEFYEKGWTYKNSTYTPEQLQERAAFRREITIPVALEESVETIITAPSVATAKKFDGKDLPEDKLIALIDADKKQREQKQDDKNVMSKAKSFYNKAKDVASGNKPAITMLKYDYEATYDVENNIKRMANRTDPIADYNKMVPFRKKEIRSYVSETPKERSGKIPKAQRNIQVGLGKAQGLKTNQRYEVRRTIQIIKSGIEKDKFIGHILATRDIVGSSKGRKNVGKTSRFYQTYGGTIRQYDKVLQDPILFTAYGGYGSNGFAAMLDFYLRRRIGNKFYLHFGYDTKGRNVEGLETLTIGGEQFETDMNVFQFGLGFSREYYFLRRFYTGYRIGGTFYNATFSDSEVKDFLVGEDASFYEHDISLELGVLAGVRITRDFSVDIRASWVNIEFDSPFQDDESEVPDLSVESYNSNVFLTLRYEIPKAVKRPKK